MYYAITPMFFHHEPLVRKAEAKVAPSEELTYTHLYKSKSFLIKMNPFLPNYKHNQLLIQHHKTTNSHL